jgi:DNA-binding GntR family transcriptional regulator
MRNRLYASCDEHDAIMAALLSGDGALARKRMRAHVNAVRLVSAHYVRSCASSDGKQHETQRPSM